MLQPYLNSVIMYFLGIWAITWIYGDRIMENNWEGDGECVDETSNFDIIMYTLFVSCIPVVRFLYIVLILVMATFTQDAVYKWFNDLENKF